MRSCLFPATVLAMTTTTRTVIHAELQRIVPDQPWPGGLMPELWVIARDRHPDMEGKSDRLPAMIGRVLADARIAGFGKASVAWTLAGVPPEGRTLADELERLGVTLHERWPDAWR